MLTLTETARAHLARLLNEAGAPEDAAARFVAGPQGLTLYLDNLRPGDETFEYEGRTVLVLDEQVADILSERTLDVEETEEGPTLTLQ
ncbi:MAG TPA: hypothetical protein VF184_06225 [Phycisphaeraceae bacterium]